MFNLSTVDFLILVGYFVICLVVGLKRASKVKTLRQFAVLGKGVPIPVLIAAIFASYIGAGSVIGTSEKIYLLGAIFVIRELLKPLQWLVLAKILAPNIGQFKDCISISQVMHKIY